MIVASYYRCPMCLAQDIGTPIGKQAYSTELIGTYTTDKVFADMPKMKTSSVGQHIWESSPTRMGNYKCILNTHCPTCGVEIVNRTVARDVIVTIARVMGRYVINRQGLESNNRFNEFTFVRKIIPREFFFLRSYAGSSHISQSSFFTPYFNLMKETMVKKDSVTPVNAEVYGRLKWGFVVIQWDLLFKAMLKNINIYIRDRGFGEIIDEYTFMSDVMAYVWSLPSLIESLGVDWLPLALLDNVQQFNDAGTGATVPEFNTEDDLASIGIKSYCIRNSESTYYYYSHMTTLMYNLRGIREYHMQDRGAHPCSRADNCATCRDGDYYYHDTDSSNCEGCGDETTLIRHEAALHLARY